MNIYEKIDLYLCKNREQAGQKSKYSKTSQKDQKLLFKTNYRLMQVKTIA